MSILPASPFIHENNPKQNLEILANFNLSDTTSTRCMTENVYRKLPKWNLSNGTMREVVLLGTSTTLLAGPFALLASKVYDCFNFVYSSDALEAKTCFSNLADALADPINIMPYACFLSGVMLAGIGTYTGLRAIFRDNSQGERFAMLDKEYLAAAHSLLDQYRAAGKKEKEGIVQIARNLVDKSDLIHAGLKQTARLTEAQASALTVKISHAAKCILQKDGSNPKALSTLINPSPVAG